MSNTEVNSLGRGFYPGVLRTPKQTDWFCVVT